MVTTRHHNRNPRHLQPDCLSGNGLVGTLDGKYPILNSDHYKGLSERELLFACLTPWVWLNPLSHEILLKTSKIVLNFSDYYTSIAPLAFNCVGDLDRLARRVNGECTTESITAVSYNAFPFYFFWLIPADKRKKKKPPILGAPICSQSTIKAELPKILSSTFWHRRSY